MRVCIPSPYPGGPETPVTADFELADMLDYYDLGPDGRFAMTAQARNCIGACIDPVEAIMRRGVESVIVRGISDSYLYRFRSAGVRVLLGPSTGVSGLLAAAAEGNLIEIEGKRK